MKVDSRGYAYIGKKFANSEFFVKEAEEGNVLILEKVVKLFFINLKFQYNFNRIYSFFKSKWY